MTGRVVTRVGKVELGEQKRIQVGVLRVQIQSCQIEKVPSYIMVAFVFVWALPMDRQKNLPTCRLT